MTLQDSTEMVAFIPSVNEKNDFICDIICENISLTMFNVYIKICNAFVLLHSNLFLTMN